MNGLQLLTGALFAALIGCSAADAQPVPPGTCALAPSVCELQGKVFDNEKCNCVDANILIEIAKTGDGLHRWIRLRTLWDRLSPNGGATKSELVELGRLVEGALPAAEAHAQALGAFFKAHAEVVNQLLGTKSGSLDEKSRSRLKGLGPDYASAGARLAQNLAAVGAEREFVRERIAALGQGQRALAVRGNDYFCDAVDAMMLEADTACIAGSESACSQGSWLAGVGSAYACPGY